MGADIETERWPSVRCVLRADLSPDLSNLYAGRTMSRLHVAISR